MTPFNSTSQWEFDAPKFYDFTKQDNPNEQVESWFAKRSEPFSRHIRPVSLSTSKRTKETATRIPRMDANKGTKNDTASSQSTLPKKRVDIFDALASTPTIASAAKRSATSSNKLSIQQQQPSSKLDTKTTTEISPLKKQSSSALPSRVPRLPQRIHLQSKDNETSIENNQQQSGTKDIETSIENNHQQQQQSATTDNEQDEWNDSKEQQQQQRISMDENVPPPHTSDIDNSVKQDDRISLSLTDFNAIFNRVEDMRAQIAEVTSTDIPKQGVDKATAITPPSPKIITRQFGTNMIAIEGRIQRAKKVIRESLAITERWFQSTEPSSSSSYLSSNKLSQISKWQHDTVDSFSSRHQESLPVRRSYSTLLPTDLDDTTRSTTTHITRTSRGSKRMAPTYLRTEPTIPKSPKFATESRQR
ncbi:hypothetical protein K492DRAFT_209231 [Lichtheimia hyalospora FSU 10163]|nr:hypothetical protein K492DRAFT_209231 [Lichtheimia hyalospora FSU 10163]